MVKHRIVKTNIKSKDSNNFIIYNDEKEFGAVQTKEEAFNMASKLAKEGHSGIKIKTNKQIIDNI